jgi:hypothetical protein
MITKKGNKIANHNGQRWEKHVERQRHVKVGVNNTCDTPRLEIKSCQAYVHNGRGQQRAGSFVFYAHQQKQLMSSRGSYIFIVHHLGRKIKQAQISAARMEAAFGLSKIPQKTICWQSLL